MRIKIYIETGNAAFDGDPLPEIRRILATIPNKIQEQMARPPSACNAPEAADWLYDVNGNKAGRINVDTRWRG